MKDLFTNVLSSWRCSPPAGGFSSPRAVLSALQCFDSRWTKERASAELEHALCAFFGASRVRIYGSGKESLFHLLCLLKREHGVYDLAVSAFGCPDLVTAALHAGYRIHAVDIDPVTLQMKRDSVDLKRGVVVLSNLYGLIDQTKEWSESFSLIDDGCQAALSVDGGCRLGARPGTHGVVSFGRGKAFCGVGGGAVVFPDGVRSETPESDSRERSWGGDLLKWGASALFERPGLYRIPATLLPVGRTRFELALRRQTLSRVGHLVALTQIFEAATRAEALIRNSGLWREALRGLPLVLPEIARGGRGAVLIRYPVLCPSRESRDGLAARLRRFGVTPSYGASLRSIVGEGAFANTPSWVGADDVASRVLTLPTHPRVTPDLVQQVLEVIAQSL